MVASLLDAGMPAEAVHPDGTIDLDAAEAAGWQMVGGLLYGPDA
jgi:hypothetical protein